MKVIISFLLVLILIGFNSISLFAEASQPGLNNGRGHNKTPTVVVPSPTTTNTPTSIPTNTPTVIPTNTPTTVPTNTSTVVPTDTPTVSPTDTPTIVPTSTATTVSTSTPISLAGQPCPQAIHDAYVTTGPDGKTYPTWHPAIDPSTGCLFGHDHGADPRTSVANSTMPAFGYVGAIAGDNEPHTGFKVAVVNAGQTVETNVTNKIAPYSSRIVFHMGTSGVSRYTTQFHSVIYDYVDGANYAHIQGMADTGLGISSTCSTQRVGKTVSTTDCPDTYEIWNLAFSVMHPSDPFQGMMQSRFSMVTNFAVFDPITTANPADLTQLIYTTNVKYPGYGNTNPLAPDAPYTGCAREAYFAPITLNNSSSRVGSSTTYYTDAFGNVGNNDTAHPLAQTISQTAYNSSVTVKYRQDFCNQGAHSPN